jgi:amphiphysin
MPNDSKLSSTNTSNPSLSGSTSKNGGSNVVHWIQKKSGTAKKKVNRLGEKFNQAIGKAEKTQDEIFETNVTNFEQQTVQANLFSKELNKYINSLKEAQKSQKSFFECLKQVYETSWPNYNELIQQCQKQEELWTHHIDLLQQCVQVPVIQYLKEFPENKKQIEKRENKLLDYDKAKHTLHDLESSKKPDELKIVKARGDLHEKQRLFNDLNTDLHSKLPRLYEERKSVYSKSFKQLFNIEKTFHTNMSESKQVLNEVCEKLMSDFGYSDEESEQVSTNGDDKEKKIKQEGEEEEDNNEEEEEEEEEEDKPSTYEYASDTLSNNNNQIKTPPLPQPTVTSSSASSSSSTSSINQKSQTNSPVLGSTTANKEPINENGLFSNILKDLPTTTSTKTTNNIPSPAPPVQEQIIPKVLFKVKATYPYQAKEIDELTFNKDELIDVIEGTESEKEDLDEGWQIGIHCLTNNRGLFPENFTKRV